LYVFQRIHFGFGGKSHSSGLNLQREHSRELILDYAIFLFPIVIRPTLLLDLLYGSTTAMFGLRETLNRIAGVFSLVNLQSLVAVLVCAYRPLTGRRLPQPYRRLIVVLAILCVLRAWLWSERLALIELALPLTAAAFAKTTSGQRARDSGQADGGGYQGP
jgi:hypothetical protein